MPPARIRNQANSDYIEPTTSAQGQAQADSLAIIDDWDEADRAKVNLIASQVGITGGAGVVAANTPRVTHASDDPAVVALQLIDDWDESDRAKVNPIVGQAGVAAGAGAVGVTVQRTTLASDDPAVAALQIIDDWDETNRAAVNLIAGQVGVTAGAGAVAANTQRTTLASDDPAVAALGTTADAKVDTDAVGTLSAKLRGTVARLAALDANLGVTTDAKVITDADGTLSAKARGLVDLLAAVKTAIEIIDDWDETNRAAVNLIASQVAVAGGAGVVGANTVRVVKGANATIAAAQVSVGIASQEIVPARVGRAGLLLRNLGAAAQKIYLGAGSVSNANGMLLEAGESIELIATQAAVNGIADGTTVSCAYLEEY